MHDVASVVTEVHISFIRYGVYLNTGIGVTNATLVKIAVSKPCF